MVLIVAFSGKYFDEISQDSGRYCFGVQETLKALEMGAVEILIVWENLEVIRYVLKNNTTTGKSADTLNSFITSGSPYKSFCIIFASVEMMDRTALQSDYSRITSYSTFGCCQSSASVAKAGAVCSCVLSVIVIAIECS